MALVLHDNDSSTNAHKVRFLLTELGLEYERRGVTLHAPTPEYRALHPFGLIPTLVDGELVITESNVALRYLAERERRDDLRGATPAQRARVDMLLDSLSLELRPVLWGLESIVLYGEPADAASTAAARDALCEALNAYERLLDATGPYALGAFTIADCALAGRLHHLDRLALDPAVAPRVVRALTATRARPAWESAIGSRATSLPD